MDRLEKLDGETKAILEAEKINGTSIVLLTDENLKAMGITQLGPRVVILSIIEELKAQASSAVQLPAAPAQEEPDQYTSVSRQLFESDGQFRLNYLYKYLDQGKVPPETGIREITRLACKRLADRRFKGGDYPLVREEQELARQIVTIFPQLKSTRVTPAAPPESRFFWMHNGERIGPHSGCVFFHIKNKLRRLPPERRKKAQPAKKPRLEEVPDELYNRAKALAKVQTTQANQSYICDEMAACFLVHQRLLRDKQKPGDIVVILPHLLSYKSVLLHEAFKRLYPNHEDPDLQKVFNNCLFFNLLQFDNVEDVIIRGCLRLMKTMPVRGQRRVTDELTQDERDAKALIRWFMPTSDSIEDYEADEENMHPHIVCLAPSTEVGSYIICNGSEMLMVVDSAVLAIGAWFKLFPVLGMKVPVVLSMLWDFLACEVYGILKHSKRTTVNKMIKQYRATVKACEENAGPSVPGLR